MNVVLGAHNLRTPEPSQQRFNITRQFTNNYNPEQKLNDILLLQVGRRGPQVLEDPFVHLQQTCISYLLYARPLGRSLVHGGPDEDRTIQTVALQSIAPPASRSLPWPCPPAWHSSI